MGPSSVEEDDSRGELNSGENISGEFVVACGDSAKVIEHVKEALDKIAFAVGREVAIARDPAFHPSGTTRLLASMPYSGAPARMASVMKLGAR